MKEKKHWTFDDIPDQTGRTAIVTGSNSGIGFETARMLAARNAYVVMACRNMEKAETARKRILDEFPQASIEALRLDLSSLQSVKEFTEAFQYQNDRLDLLINNAGVMIPPLSKTEDDFELQFGVNHLGHFALTGLLLPLINGTPESRIVVVTSTAHHFGKINFDNLNAEKSYSKWPFYGQSKIANLLFSHELQRKLQAWGYSTLVTSAHPGWTATDLQRHSGFIQFLNRFWAMQTEQGALPTLFAATYQDASAGALYGPDGFREMKGYPTQVKAHRRSHDRAVAARLWEVSEELTGVVYDRMIGEAVD